MKSYEEVITFYHESDGDERSYGSDAVGDNDLANAYATQTITGRIAVHDPSIVMDVTGSTTNPKYYIYGSHLGRAKTYASGNYQIWNTFKTGEENTGTSNSLFADVNGKLINFKDAYTTHVIKKVKNYKARKWLSATSMPMAGSLRAIP